MILDLQAVLRRWLPLAALATVLCGLAYVVVQQSQRSGANDPQLQLAEDAAAALERGTAPESVIPPGPAVVIEASLATFVVVYAADGRPVAGSGLLHGRLPSPPGGVFDFVRANGGEEVTLQPERGVRIASVVRRVARGPGADAREACGVRGVVRWRRDGGGGGTPGSKPYTARLTGSPRTCSP
jgi:hypothetical protein